MKAMKKRRLPSLSDTVKELKALETKILQAGKDQIGAHDGIYTFDLYCTAILNKAINIQAGYA